MPANLDAAAHFSGKTALVTGAASGIGFALAEALAEAGANVVLADVEDAALSAAAERLAGRGFACVPVRADVTDPADVEAAADLAMREFGKLHIACNNAGVTRYLGALDMRIADWNWVLSVNLMGVVHGVQAAAPRILATGEGGHILNTGSVASIVPMRNLIAYCTSKAAVAGLSDALRLDLAPHGIGVSLLCPGPVESRLAESARNRPSALRTEVEAGRPSAPSGAPARMSAREVASRALKGMANNAPYIFTHAEYESEAVARWAMIEAGFCDLAGETAAR